MLRHAFDLGIRPTNQTTQYDGLVTGPSRHRIHLRKVDNGLIVVGRRTVLEWRFAKIELHLALRSVWKVRIKLN
jgi:hypothetical protein